MLFGFSLQDKAIIAGELQLRTEPTADSAPAVLLRQAIG